MAASVSAIWNALLTLDETVASALTAVEDQPIRHDFAGIANLPSFSGVIDADSTPAITKGFSGQVTVPGGAIFTLDLTALTGPSATTVDFTGLEVQLVLLAALTNNVSSVAVKTKDSTTGYNLFGPTNTGTDVISLSSGQIALFQLNDKQQDVDSTHKDVNFIGTTGDIVAIIMVAG